MRNKLEINANHFSIETLRKTYVKNRIDDNVNKHIVSRIRKKSRNFFLTIEDIFACLFRVFEDSNRKHTILQEFRRLRQSEKKFNFFWANFQRLTIELDHNEKTLIEELRHKLSMKIQM